MCAVKFAESVPSAPSIRISDWYQSSVYPWLYVYRYTGEQSKIDAMVKKANQMAAHGYDYYYKNPGFGEKPWCCVTFCSYLVYAAGITKKTWVMGSSYNDYFWSPRYGGNAYDDFLIDNGFKKYDFSQIGKAGLKAGDILQRWDHAVTVVQGNSTPAPTGGFDVALIPTIKRGSTGNCVKNLQALLNLWMNKETPLKIDGQFGALTETRLKQYQKIQKLYVDGICGEKTWADILVE